MCAEAYRFTCQHAASFNQLSCRCTGIIETHRTSVQAIDQQEGQGRQQQGIVFLQACQVAFSRLGGGRVVTLLGISFFLCLSGLWCFSSTTTLSSYGVKPWERGQRPLVLQEIFQFGKVPFVSKRTTRIFDHCGEDGHKASNVSFGKNVPTRFEAKQKKTWGNNIWRPANFVGRISEEVLLENLWNHTNLYKSPLNVGSSRALITSSGGSTCSIGRPRRKKTVRSQPPQSHPAG